MTSHFVPEKMLTILLVFTINNSDTTDTSDALGSTLHSMSYQKILNSDRVITDLEIIYGCHGVEIINSYSETSHSNSGAIVSAPGCPKSIDGYPWLHYGNPPRCYLAAHHGPCPFGEKLLIQRWSSYGVCGCECLFEYDFSRELESRDRYVRCWKKADYAPPGNEQIYDKHAKKCYYRYEQGPCPLGRVIVDFTSNSLKCLPLCDETRPDWVSIREQGLCDTPKYILDSKTVGVQNQCDDDEHFSNILQKCVKRYPGKKFVIEK